MYIKNHKLVGHNQRNVPFETTKNMGSKLQDPRFLVIHYTSGGTASGAISWFKNPKAKASSHLVIDHEGGITQMVPFNHVAWHAGVSRWRDIKNINSHSIGIEITNWGKLQKSATGGWVSRTGKPIPNERVIIAPHRHRPDKEFGWEVYDAEQIEATIDAARAIVEEYNISPWNVIGHDDVAPNRKTDPGPVFEMDYLREAIFGMKEENWNNNLYKVSSSTGLNLRKDPKISGDLIENLPNGTIVHVIEKIGNWWLVAKIKDNQDDTTGYVHSYWLEKEY